MLIASDQFSITLQRQIFVFFSFWVLANPMLGASTPLDSSIESLPVQEIGRRASENASLLKMQAAEVQASRLEAEGSGLLPNPSLAMQLGGLKSGDSSGKTIETTLTQIIPFPGKLSTQSRLKDLEAKIVESTAEQSKTLIQHTATLKAFQWVVLDEQAKHFQEREKRFRLIRQFLKSRPIVSPAAKTESYLIEGQIELLEKTFKELEQEKNSIALELSYFLQTPNTVIPRAQWIAPGSLAENVGSAEALVRSPELKRKQLEIAQAEQNVEKARLQSLPDISLGAGYRNEAVSPANHFYYGAIGLTIPLFDRGQYARPAARAKLEAERTREGLLRSKLSQQLEVARARLSSARELATKFDLDRIERIDARFAEVDREFRKGRVSTSVLLQTDAQLHESVAAIYEAQLTLAGRLSELYSLLGEPLSWK